MTPGRKSWCPARARCQVSTRVLNRGWKFLNGGYQLEKSSINGDFLKWWYPKWSVYRENLIKMDDDCGNPCFRKPPNGGHSVAMSQYWKATELKSVT